MERVMTWLKTALVLVSIGVMVQLGLVLHQVQKTAEETQKTLVKLQDSSKQLDLAVKNFQTMGNSVLYLMGDTAKEVADSTREQKEYWKKASQQSVAVLKSTDDLLVSAKKQIEKVGETADAISKSQQQITQATTAALESVPKTLDAGTKGLEAATKTLETANKAISDANIPATMAEVHGIAADTHRMTSAVAPQVEKAMKKSWTKRLLGFVPAMLMKGLDIVF